MFLFLKGTIELSLLVFFFFFLRKRITPCLYVLQLDNLIVIRFVVKSIIFVALLIRAFTLKLSKAKNVIF